MAILTITKSKIQDVQKISEPCIALLEQFLPQFEEKIKAEAQLGRKGATAKIGDIADVQSAEFISQYIVGEFKDAGFSDDDIDVSYQKSAAIKNDFIISVNISWE